MHDQAAGSARRAGPDRHTGNAQQVSSKYAADEQWLKRRQGQDACPPAATTHDIDTCSQPQGCGGQQGWNLRGIEEGGRRSLVALLTGDCCWGRQPQRAAHRPNVILEVSLSALWYIQRTKHLPCAAVCQSKSQSLGCDRRLKNRQQRPPPNIQKPPPANRTTPQESDTSPNLTKGPSTPCCRHTVEAMPSWQKCCSPRPLCRSPPNGYLAHPTAPWRANAIRRATSSPRFH